MATEAVIAGKRRAQLDEHLDRARHMTLERLTRVPASPMYQSTNAQLEAIGSDVATGRAPSPEIRDRIMFGVYAAREIEGVDPEYADVLPMVSYLYEHGGAVA